MKLLEKPVKNKVREMTDDEKILMLVDVGLSQNAFITDNIFASTNPPCENSWRIEREAAFRQSILHEGLEHLLKLPITEIPWFPRYQQSELDNSWENWGNER